ncbi:hypothetical protein DB721_07430 [Helicobacter pylori]|uniref:Uncharacterized protein n=1 Tax=Helicobacter pylori TaxID=210 RepID=A0A7Z6X6P9_HELPX|nr:hypothetical protein DB721_07430 [Helicobacter pylori]
MHAGASDIPYRGRRGVLAVVSVPMCVSYDVTNLLRRFKPISLDSLCKKIAPNLITKDTK